MIGIRIIGGLGNQMFQYSTIKSLSLQIGKDFKLDIRGFQKYSRNVFLLDRFNISGLIANEEDYKRYKWSLRRPCRVLQSIGINKIWFQEQNYYYDKNLINLKDNIFLYGYYHSYKYFEKIIEVLREDFTLKKELNGMNRNISEIIKHENSVMVHVRRDDYLTNHKINSDYGICSLEYYKQAIDYVSERVNNPHFIFFSDDFEWTKKTFNLRYPITFVEGNYYEPEIDLFLMSMCKHHIIANSTMSWWGAWLSRWQNKIIISPEKWFRNSKLSTQDLIPNNWIKL